jgi:POT family proton-dependent oligopeptide transporter
LFSLKGPILNTKKVIGLTLLNLLLVFYYAAIFQINGSLIVGIEKEFRIELFGWVIPSTTFASLQALFAIMLTPFLTKIWDYLSQKMFEPTLLFKIGVGLLCAGIGFGLLSIVFATKTYPLLNITLASVFIGISTATIMPAHLTAVSQYAPTHLQGTLMGVSYLSDALGGYIGSNMTKYAYSFSPFIQNPSIYTDTYISIALLLFSLTVLWLLMTSLLNFLFNSKRYLSHD